MTNIKKIELCTTKKNFFLQNYKTQIMTIQKISRTLEPQHMFFFKEVCGHKILLLKFLVLKPSTETRVKPMHFLVCNLFQKSTL